MLNDDEIEFKVLLVGDSKVGKTSILLQFTEETYSEAHVMTIGIDYKVKRIQMDNYKINLKIWDSAGQERFQSITKNYYKGADAVVFVFDITDRDSFTNLKKWIKQAEDHVTNKNYKKIIVGNKDDLEPERKVEQKEISYFAKKNNIDYIETSAKTNHNITEVFSYLVNDLLKDYKVNLSIEGMKLADFKDDNDSKSCQC